MTWKLFKGNSSEEARELNPSSINTEESIQNGSKGKPTPKRKQAEQNNLRPIVPKDRKASRKAAKARMRAKEDEQYEAMRTGDLIHMPKDQQLPVRIYIRDYVDARFGLAELTMPVILIFFIVTIVSAYFSQSIYLIMNILLYAFAFAVIIDLTFMWYKLKKRLAKKFGEQAVARGSRSATYAWTRAWQIRRWRIPKPRYPKRGHWPE